MLSDLGCTCVSDNLLKSNTRLKEIILLKSEDLSEPEMPLRALCVQPSEDILGSYTTDPIYVPSSNGPITQKMLERFVAAEMEDEYCALPFNHDAEYAVRRLALTPSLTWTCTLDLYITVVPASVMAIVIGEQLSSLSYRRHSECLFGHSYS